ncbi:MAG: hypothetical protein KKE20_04645 [Nanoarchaeota archaeon]|nr:hypothetical protein [Nanoarchaeota archaeon]
MNLKLIIIIVLVLFLASCNPRIERQPRGDVSICQNSQGEDKINCLDSVYFDKARLTEDPAICEKVSEKKRTLCYDNTYLSLGKEKNENSFCNDIENTEIKGECYGMVAVSTKSSNEVCNELEEESKFSCLYIFAAFSEDMELCKEVTGISISGNTYKDMCYKSVGYATECASCEFIEDERLKVSCSRICS